MKKSFVLGVVLTLVVGIVVAALVIWSGVIDISASNAPRGLDKVLNYASRRSIAHHARNEKNPLAQNATALTTGLQNYQSMCIACHGGPGTEPAGFAAGLHPQAPDLASPRVQSFTDGMLYETVARGIGSTGMPAFEKTHTPQEIWSIVAFVRHLPALTPDEKNALSGAMPSAPPTVPPTPPTDAGAPGEATNSPGAVHQVTISNFKYEPETTTVHLGDVVEWKNTDFVAHTATANDGTFDTGRIDPSASKRIMVKKKGQFPYFCRYHTGMHGTLIVQ